MKVTVVHRPYGLGCGHIAIVDGVERDATFAFSHPYGGSPIEFAEDFVRDQLGDEFVLNLDWYNCRISDD